MEEINNIETEKEFIYTIEKDFQDKFGELADEMEIHKLYEMFHYCNDKIINNNIKEKDKRICYNEIYLSLLSVVLSDINKHNDKNVFIHLISTEIDVEKMLKFIDSIRLMK